MKTAALLTKHAKAEQIAPVLYDLGIELVEINFYDTDQLGTFAGEVERQLSPRDCALEKAKKAVEYSGLNVGLGSEGSFGGGAVGSLLNWNDEIICLYQKEPELTIFASASGPTPLRKIQADSLDALRQALSQFAAQKWILRCADGVLKGLSDRQILALHQTSYTKWPVTVEPDLRAMHSPLRQVMIRKAALNLSERLQSRCPQCDAVDFWPDEREIGPSCHSCGHPTNEIKGYISRCVQCGFHKHETVLEVGDQRHCDHCNP